MYDFRSAVRSWVIATLHHETPTEYIVPPGSKPLTVDVSQFASRNRSHAACALRHRCASPLAAFSSRLRIWLYSRGICSINRSNTADISFETTAYCAFAQQ